MWIKVNTYSKVCKIKNIYIFRTASEVYTADNIAMISSKKNKKSGHYQEAVPETWKWEGKWTLSVLVPGSAYYSGQKKTYENESPISGVICDADHESGTRKGVSGQIFQHVVCLCILSERVTLSVSFLFFMTITERTSSVKVFWLPFKISESQNGPAISIL